ncbi:unnamed protein product [Brassica rapa]|uniref:Ubiquitin-like protease family profile domain-containing protein n=1 Tax=Brassica campestris TaxID=3711 RepID=A0A8D9H8D0_BRACM|nr:unnamed protein product [Brassica rapa]
MVASKGSWKWTQECSAVEGTKPLTNHVYVKQEPPQQTVNEDRRAQKRARTEMFTEAPSEPTSDPPTESSASWNWLKRGKNEQMFKDMTKVMTNGFGQCVKEMNLLVDKMEYVEKKVGINQKGTNSNELQLTVSDLTKPALEPGSESVNQEKVRSLNNVHDDNIDPSGIKEPSVVIMDKQKSTISDLMKQDGRCKTKKDDVMALCRAKSDRERKLDAAHQSSFKGNRTAKLIIPTKKIGHEYDLFATVDKHKVKVLVDYLKKRSISNFLTHAYLSKLIVNESLWYAILRTPMKWLVDSVIFPISFEKSVYLVMFLMQNVDGFINLLRLRFSNNPEHFRTDSLCFLDHHFEQMWINKYGEFKSSETGYNAPKYRQTKKVWGSYVDDIYAPVKYNNDHWIAIWISIPNKHLTIWDSTPTHIRTAQLAELMKPFTTMVPYLLVEFPSSD